MKFECKICGIDISKDLKGPIEFEKLNFKDGEPHVWQGHYAIVDVDFRNSFENDYVININDRQNLKYTSKMNRRNGCCGLDGCNGPNLECRNGHEVATECSDCWMPHGVVFHKESVSFVLSEKNR